MSKKVLIENNNEINPAPLPETQPVKKAKPIFKTNQPVPVEIPQDVNIPEGQIPADLEPVRKQKRGGWIWIGILGMLLIGAIGGGIGYLMAIDSRMHAELDQRLTRATTEFELALNDEKNGNLNAAQQRLEYVLEVYPGYPGLDAKLKDVMLAIALNQGSTELSTPIPGVSPTPASTPIPTTDTKNVSVLFKQAQAQLTGSDWTGLLTTVNSIRDLDPFYESVKVDGMYYLALRNNGISKIKEGSLEPGIFYFSLAEQMAPIDSDAESYRIWARLYDNAASYWIINMLEAATRFSELYALVPNLIDSSGITVRTRYAGALEGYGDILQQTFLWCEAVTQYEASSGIVNNAGIQAKITSARDYCTNPPATPTPTEAPITPTPTETPVDSTPTSG